MSRVSITDMSPKPHSTCTVPHLAERFFINDISVTVHGTTISNITTEDPISSRVLAVGVLGDI